MDSNYNFNLTQEQEEFYEKLMISQRRHIHQNAELSMKEFQTHDFILTALQQIGFQEIFSGIAGTGIVAVLRGEVDESILFRADSDALPIEEATDLPFKSQNTGVMHACGHDGHVAMLLAAAKHLFESVQAGLKLYRGIKFCFQPGEEGTNGAQKMIADKEKYDVLEASPKVVHCFALHIMSGGPLGQFYYQTGPFSSYSERFEIIVIGKGGHAMAPEETIDALQIGAQIVNAAYQIKGRNVSQTNGSTVSIGVFQAGQAPTIISDKAVIKGSIRTLDEDDRKAIHTRLEKLCLGAQEAHDCQVTLTWGAGYKSVINDPSLENQIKAAISRVGALGPHTYSLAGEDFYNFSDAKPSAYIAIGAALTDSLVKGRNIRPHHSPVFDFDEKALLNGLKLWLSLVQEFQKRR